MNSITTARLRAAFVVLFFAVCSKTVLGDTIYGSASTGSAGNSIYSIDTNTGAANLLIGGLRISPNSLATDSTRNRLYYGDGNGTTLWSYDLAGGLITQVFDLSSSPLFTTLRGATLSDGGAFYNGSYYAIVQRNLPGGNVGGGNSIYQFDLTPNGTAVSSVTQMTIGTPGGISIGDLGDFTISQNGTVFGSSWDPPGNDTQVGGYWSFSLSDPNGTFQLIQDTTGLGNGAPTYQLATGTDGTIFGTDFFTPLRLDRLDMNANIVPGVTITGFDGSSFTDLSSSITAVPEPSAISCLGMLFACLVMTKRRIRR